MRPDARPWALAGFSGCGKTTLAPLVAALAGRECVDLDARLGDDAIRRLLRRGDAALREAEARELAALAGLSGIVVALGGGTLEGAASRALLERFTLAWIDVPLAECLRRCAAEGRDRPVLAAALAAGRVEELHEQRAARARGLPTVDGTGPPSEVAQRVHRLLSMEP